MMAPTNHNNNFSIVELFLFSLASLLFLVSVFWSQLFFMPYTVILRKWYYVIVLSCVLCLSPLHLKGSRLSFPASFVASFCPYVLSRTN